MLSPNLMGTHKMKHDIWSTKDKLQQYRGILRLYARDKKLQAANLLKQKKKLSRNLKSLSQDVKEYRAIINDVLNGDKRHLLPLFLGHKDLLLTLINLPGSEILPNVYQDSFVKRKQLDKVFFKRKQKVTKFLELKLKSIDVSNKTNQEDDSPDREQQNLISSCQRSEARHNAAKSIQNTYTLMLKILKKDTIYFDNILEVLSKDQKEQCKVILKTTLIGQLTAEGLDNNRKKYNDLSSEILINMKERERTLKAAREQVEDVYGNAQSLIRLQSDTNIAEKLKDEPKTDGELEEQIETLEKVLEKVKESFCVLSVEELHSRLEEQFTQKNRLTNLCERALQEKDVLLEKSQQAKLILDNLEHTITSTTEDYKQKKKEILEDIKIEKLKRKDCNTTRDNREKLIMEIRVILQSIADSTIIVDESDLNRLSEEENIIEKDDVLEEEKLIAHLPKVETDVIALLAEVSRKVALLFSATNFELGKEKEEKAKDLYDKYVSDYKSKKKFGEELEPSGITEEYESIDPNILTRKDIKKRSRQVVEARLRNR